MGHSPVAFVWFLGFSIGRLCVGTKATSHVGKLRKEYPRVVQAKQPFLQNISKR